jgi:release factor glutamine methyltransferase
MGKNSFIEREELWLLKDKYKSKPSPSYYADIKRLRRGKPLSYLIGWVPFWDTSIKVSPGTLIPRTETEYLTEKAVSEIKTFYKKNLHILDIFCGSGCMGISALKHLENSHITFSDKYEPPLFSTRKNLRLNKIKKERFSIVRSDFLERISDSFDVVFANPPYLSKEKLNFVDKSVLLWEPQEALFAENNGFYYLFKLIENCRKILKKNGVLYLEHDDWQARTLREKISKVPGISFECIHDQFGKERMLKIFRHA